MFETVEGKIVLDMTEQIRVLREALKTLLFNKRMRMNGATSKDFSDGEASQAIQGYSSVITDFCSA